MLQQRGALTFNEIQQQSEIWRDTISIVSSRCQELAAWLPKEAFGQVVFMGAGSSFNAALVSSRFFGIVTGVATNAFPSTEIFAANRLPFEERRKTLVVTFSRSSDTSVTLWAIEKLKTKYPNTRHLLITTNASGAMNALVDQQIVLPKAKEESDVSTKAYTSSILALKLFTAVLMKNELIKNELLSLPDKLVVKKYQNEIQKITAVKPIHICVSGNGILYGHACETSAIIKKMSSVSAESNYTSELLHGEANHLTPNMLSIILAGDLTKKFDGYIAGALSQNKCQRLVVCEKADNKLGNADYLIELNSGLSEYTRDLLMIEIMQELGFYLSVSKAYNPDKPKHVQHVVKHKEHLFE